MGDEEWQLSKDSADAATALGVVKRETKSRIKTVTELFFILNKSRDTGRSVIACLIAGST